MRNIGYVSLALLNSLSVVLSTIKYAQILQTFLLANLLEYLRMISHISKVASIENLIESVRCLSVCLSVYEDLLAKECVVLSSKHLYEILRSAILWSCEHVF